MFIVESIAKIRRMYYVEGKGIRTIARALNISKNTVKKVIRSDKTKFELTQHSRKKPALERLCSEGYISLQFGRNYPIFTELH